MSPARQHRDRFAGTPATPIPANPIVSNAEGGRTAAYLEDTPLTPAREHRITHAVAAIVEAGEQPTIVGIDMAEVDPVAAQFRLRLTHDMRRLKEIQSIERKIEAKREMILAYEPWITAQLDAERGAIAADGIFPTMMVWAIDIGDWPYALRLASRVLGDDVALPARYQRTAPALIAEEVADAAIKAQLAGHDFPLDVLESVEALVADADMHDEIRAKLMKALGTEIARAADAIDPASPEFAPVAERALAALRRASDLNPRAGVKDRIRRLEKALAPAKPSNEQAGDPPAA